MKNSSKWHQTKEAVLLRQAYPLTNRGVCEVLEYVEDGEKKHIEWLGRNNPPAVEIAETLRKLTAVQLVQVWPKLEKSLEAQTALREVKAIFETAKQELIDVLHPEEAAARLAELEKAGDEWWEREGKYEAELEERGEIKYYWYERDRAEKMGKVLTMQEYCDGLTADDDMELEDM